MTLGQVVEMNRRFSEAYERFQDELKIIRLREDVTRYNRLLRDIGLRDHQVCNHTRTTADFNLRNFVFRLGSRGREEHMEDIRSSIISSTAPPRMDNLGFARCHSEWPDIRSCLYHIEEESKTFVL